MAQKMQHRLRKRGSGTAAAPTFARHRKAKNAVHRAASLARLRTAMHTNAALSPPHTSTMLVASRIAAVSNVCDVQRSSDIFPCRGGEGKTAVSFSRRGGAVGAVFDGRWHVVTHGGGRVGGRTSAAVPVCKRANPAGGKRHALEQHTCVPAHRFRCGSASIKARSNRGSASIGIVACTAAFYRAHARFAGTGCAAPVIS